MQFLSKICLINICLLQMFVCFALFCFVFWYFGCFFCFVHKFKIYNQISAVIFRNILFKICLSDPNYCIILINYTMLKFRPSFGSKISTYFSVNTIYSFSWGKWNFVLITKSLYQYLGLWNNGSKMITCRSIKWYLDVPSLATLTKKISYGVYIV